MQSTGEAMGIGLTFGAAYWKAWLGAGVRRLPFGRPVYVSLPAEDEALLERLVSAGCTVMAPAHRRFPGCDAVEPAEVDVSSLGMAIALDASPDDLSLLRRAIPAGVPCVSTRGGIRALVRALEEGEPCLAISCGL
jgi:hypothetical protein